MEPFHCWPIYHWRGSSVIMWKKKSRKSVISNIGRVIAISLSNFFLQTPPFFMVKWVSAIKNRGYRRHGENSLFRCYTHTHTGLCSIGRGYLKSQIWNKTWISEFFRKHQKLFWLYLSNQISLRGRFVFERNGRIWRPIMLLLYKLSKKARKKLYFEKNTQLLAYGLHPF